MMEGKDYNIVLNAQDIDYMFNIVNSEIDESEKAKKLYSYCKIQRIENNIKYLKFRNSFLN